MDNITAKQSFSLVDAFDDNTVFVTIDCRGESPRPEIVLSEDILDFGRTNIEKNESIGNPVHSLKITNASKVALTKILFLK